MTANTPLYIHEFGTGINPDGNSENWISRGFTGQYMNSTLSEIPYNVERSIANDEFKVAESVDKDMPSMVGRVVLANGGANDWSVVAVITRGKDEYVRSLTVTRYFLAEGADSLSRIVAWLDFRAKQERLPVYNPFEIKIAGKPNVSTAPIVKTRVTSDIETQLRNSSTPLIVSPDSYLFPVLDSLARRKSELTGQPASWAYNVEALEKPERFQIILPASDRALSLIQQALATKPKDQAASAIDEKALKQAIKGLADNLTVKPDQWQTFVENIFVVASAFPDPNKAGDYWKRLFDGQGASNAIKQGIYTQPMIRLLTIRAIALPETLPDFLQWLQVGTDKKGGYSEISLEFQGQLSGLSQEPRLKDFLIEGIRDLVGKILTKAVAPESVVWLLLSKTSLWGQFRSQIRNDFRHDLQVVGNLARGMQPQDRLIISGKFWDKIWQEIQQYWRVSPTSFNEKYAPLANFFDQLGDSFVSAHFCQLSYGQVPSELFKQAFPSKRGLTTSHGLRIRQQGYNERGEKTIVPVPLVAAIAVLMLSIGFGGGLLTSKLMSRSNTYQDSYTENNLENKVSKPKPSTLPETFNPETPIPPDKPSTSNPQNNSASIAIPPEELAKGMKTFKTTKDSLTSIITKSKEEYSLSDDDIINAIKDSLGNKSLDYYTLVSDPSNDKIKQEWLKAIYRYNQETDAIIGDKTRKKLLEDVRRRIISKENKSLGREGQ